MTVAGDRRRQAGRDRDRIVNLSDAVFAIAMTLLVLDLRVPDLPEGLVDSELPAALLSLWPKYLGYVLSFVVIGTFWVIHHSIFRSIRRYDRTLLWLNFLFLMFVAFVPFPPRCSANTATTSSRWRSTRAAPSPWAGCC